MSDVQIGLSGLAVLFVLIALRLPVGLALIGVSFAGLWYMMGWGIAWGRRRGGAVCALRHRFLSSLATRFLIEPGR